MSRYEVTNAEITDCLNMFKLHYSNKLFEKGKGIFVSSHEIDGVLGEEVQEWQVALHTNDAVLLQAELLDVMVSAFHGLVSLRSGQMDWPQIKKEN